ncbi:MAG: metallophosphoesterase [Armatimonadota bacterium]
MRFDFTVAVISDTQNYSEKHPDVFHAQTRWLAESARRERIVFASHVGDVVQNGGQRQEEWDVASAAMARLYGKVPCGVVAGNHDYDDLSDKTCPLTIYRRNFGASYHKKVPTLLELSPDECSSIHMFNAGGIRMLSLHLEPDPRDAALAWAESVLAKYPDMPVIVTTHIYISDVDDARDRKPYSRTAGNSGEDVFQKFIRKQPRIFLVLCGHWWTRGGETSLMSTNDYGGRVHELLSDFQGRPNGGDGWLRLLRFDLKGHLLHVQTYSPTLKRYETDLDSDFTLPLDLHRAIPSEPARLQKAWRRPAPQWRPGGIADLRMLDAGITPKGRRIR